MPFNLLSSARTQDTPYVRLVDPADGSARAALMRSIDADREKEQRQLHKTEAGSGEERLPAPSGASGSKAEPFVLDMRGATLAHKGDLVIDGNCYDGTIDVGRLIISENAFVSGTVRATEIRNRGKLVGDVVADRVYLYKGSVLEGTVHTGNIAISGGCAVTANILIGSQHSLATLKRLTDGDTENDQEAVNG